MSDKEIDELYMEAASLGMVSDSTCPEKAELKFDPDDLDNPVESSEIDPEADDYEEGYYGEGELTEYEFDSASSENIGKHSEYEFDPDDLDNPVESSEIDPEADGYEEGYYGEGELTEYDFDEDDDCL
ncbi:MAG: hypothetical protein ACTFAL_00155 [Candidatus Electronema sp. V4]|uniref:hypothetical protein n=1 Tax=Candidatus Electronema sp. V4 TaxID=3454756 RepID=UPI00405558BE